MAASGIGIRWSGYAARRGQQFSGSPDSPDVVCDSLPWMHFEVNHVMKSYGRSHLATPQTDIPVKGLPYFVVVLVREDDWRVEDSGRDRNSVGSEAPEGRAHAERIGKKETGKRHKNPKRTAPGGRLWGFVCIGRLDPTHQQNLARGADFCERGYFKFRISNFKKEE